MLKICCVTFDHTVNYGSCLQAFALMRVCSNNNVSETRYDIVPLRSLKDYPFDHKGVVKWLTEMFVRGVGISFRIFDKRFLSFSDCKSLSDLEKLNDSYDVFICGSDVIWSPDFNKGVRAYFLDFAHKYAFSYAASFGKAQLPKEYLQSLNDHLSHLRQISVREASSVDVIENNTNKKAVVVADPVLLLNTQEWDQIAEASKPGEAYVFVYITHINSTIERFIDHIKKQTGLKIVRAVYGPKQALKYKAYPPSPERWIGQLRDAKYVITNSFHATAFSVLYHKKFFTVVHGEKSGGINVRMYDFLHELGLEDRLLNAVPDVLNLDEIDYTRADARLEELRKESMAFLQENLEAAYQEKLKLEQKEQ